MSEHNLYAIDILLPTCNGEKFLPAQIESLLRQTCTDWRLIIRDDLSSDGTMLVINEYKNIYPDKIFLLDNQSVKKGIVGSFDRLIEASAAPYVAFCDQDDVWNSDKLLLQVKKIRELESIHGGSMPLLVHTDLSVVDEQLGVIAESFWGYQHLSPGEMCSLSRMLVQNSVTGCTVLINRSLAELARPIPEVAIMHDWWLSLIAVSEGVVCDMELATVMYRQHGANDTGAKRWGIGFVVNGLLRERDAQMESLLKTRIQAEALLNANILGPENKRIVERYISLYESNWFMRRVEMFRGGFFKYGIIRNIAMFLRI